MNIGGSIRDTLRIPWNVCPELSAVSIGADHHVATRLRTAAASIAASVPRPSLVASQRVRVMLWVQASRWVPVSSSRATSGAPQNTPTTAGSATTDAAAIA
jgi:hypothetical protein